MPCPVQTGTMLTFTVITPTGGRLNFLKENIRSVQAQVLAGVEARVDQVVLCSGADRDTLEWFASDEKPEGVTFICDDADALPPGLARNKAIAQATGDWILVLDDDDVMLQRTVHGFARAILDNPDRRWLISDFVRVDEELRYVPGQDYYGWPFDTPADMLRAIFRSETFVQGNVCFQKSLFDEVGGYDPARRTAEDLELYTRFLLAGAAPLAVPITSHLHRVHSQNTSKGIDANHHFKDLREIYGKLEVDLRAQGIGLELPGQ